MYLLCNYTIDIVTIVTINREYDTRIIVVIFVEVKKFFIL